MQVAAAASGTALERCKQTGRKQCSTSLKTDKHHPDHNQPGHAPGVSASKHSEKALTAVSVLLTEKTTTGDVFAKPAKNAQARLEGKKSAVPNEQRRASHLPTRISLSSTLLPNASTAEIDSEKRAWRHVMSCNVTGKGRRVGARVDTKVLRCNQRGWSQARTTATEAGRNTPVSAKHRHQHQRLHETMGTTRSSRIKSQLDIAGP